MAVFTSHPLMRIFRQIHFPYTRSMYPFQFKEYYHNLPIDLPDQPTIRANIHRYISGYTDERCSKYWGFRSRARKFYKDRGTGIEYDWLSTHGKRVQLCFYGQGLPEEIAAICRMAVECGHVKVHNVKDWAEENFGTDCVGFANAYYCSLGSFDSAHYFIPNYKKIGGVALSSADVRYDNAVLVARPKAGSTKGHWEVCPNPGNGNGAHIGVIDRWCDYGRSFWMTHQTSSWKYGILTEIFDILEWPDTTDEKVAHWTIRRRSGGRKWHVIITKEMPNWSAAEAA